MRVAKVGSSQLGSFEQAQGMEDKRKQWAAQGVDTLEGSVRPSTAAKRKDPVSGDAFDCENVLEVGYDAESEKWEKGEVCGDDGVGHKWMVEPEGDSQETVVGLLQESSVDAEGTRRQRKPTAPVNRSQKKDVGMPTGFGDCGRALQQFECMAPEKTEGSSTSLVCLGIELNSVSMIARLLRQKVEEFQALFQEVMGERHLT
ncbi:hypothetical protein NDU88_007224 [Pleurodeles waltl]|uniref:Uncharacterized protein n=1 Tax=Pleurodeles waltl TaxID=8319 RepID=A0AAV7UPA1_PLEWA|nr:hypothetical protein NDU88_007224 [Pleurodeles waltl]